MNTKDKILSLILGIVTLGSITATTVQLLPKGDVKGTAVIAPQITDTPVTNTPIPPTPTITPLPTKVISITPTKIVRKPTPTLTPKPTRVPATPTPLPPTPTGIKNNNPYSLSGSKECTDFETHAQAQAYFTSKGGSPSNNIDDLDPDNDGSACEDLP